MKSSNNRRIRAIMFEQQLKHLKRTIEEIQATLENEAKKRKDFEWAFITHDKDVNEGRSVEPHLHVIARTGKGAGLTLDAWAEMFNDTPNRIEKWQGQFNNAIAYLVHQTDSAQDKFQYPIEAVTGNIDILQALTDGKRKAKGANKRTNPVHQALQKLDLQLDTLDNLASQLIGNDKVEFLRKAKDLVDYQKRLPQPLIPIENIYIYGPAGSGKTRLARALAKSYPTVTASTKDPFGQYKKHPTKTIIMDDLRPRIFETGELLRILDPFNDQRYAPSRYHDADLRSIEQLFITNINSPYIFWSHQSWNEPYDQFKRRLTHIYKIDGQTGTYEDEFTRQTYTLPWLLEKEGDENN